MSYNSLVADSDENLSFVVSSGSWEVAYDV
jgi:hypothetical protein